MKLNIAWISIVLLALLTPTLYWILSPEQRENVRYHSWPDVLKDRYFFAREQAFTAYRPLKKALHSPVLPERLMKGDSEFLFLGNFFSDAVLKSKGFWRLDSSQLALTRSYLEQQQRHLQKQNTEYIIAMAPNKATFYGDYLPIAPTGQLPLRGQLDSLFQKSPIPFISLLQNRKPPKDSLLYYLYDSHWNHEGAWLAYQELMAALRQTHPELRVLRNEDMCRKVVMEWAPDLTELLLTNESEKLTIIAQNKRSAYMIEDELTVPPTYRNKNDNYERRFRNDSAQLKILVLHDSFFNAMLRWFAESFNETVYVWSYSLDTALIARENPDIVLHFMVERNADRLYNQALKKMEAKK